MGTLRTLPTYEVVQRTYPRPTREGDEIAKAIGRAIDGALSQIGHQARIGRRPTVSAMRATAETLLDEEIETAGEDLSPELRAKTLTEIQGVLLAYRASPILGLPRPKSRLIVIGNEVGIYAQPDYWDGARRFFEMKSYLAIPPPPDVALQLRLFQLAFPGLESILICLDRHASPVTVRTLTLPPPTPEESALALRRAYDLAREHGEPKVLEYLEGPFVPYPIPPPVL
ncbi:MAG TPA: hypothetical protein VML94_05295 [Thermoplasmata archaeon]|nr:hypothetical protein [Thermoplasmata archaeon]